MMFKTFGKTFEPRTKRVFSSIGAREGDRGVSSGNAVSWRRLEELEPRLALSAAGLQLHIIHGPTGDLRVPTVSEPPTPPQPTVPRDFALGQLSGTRPLDPSASGSDTVTEAENGPQPPDPSAPGQGLNFTATSLFSGSGSIPPDTMGAVGPNHIVELINGSYAVFDKASGSELDRSSLNGFWTDAGITPNGAFDPRVIYDRSVNRFYAAAVNNARSNNEFLFAISQTNNPLDGWLGFAVDTDSGTNERWADFPQLSFDDESIHIGANMFDQPGGGNFSTTRSTLVISKADLLDRFPDISERTLIEDHENTTGFSAQGVVYNPDPTGGLPSLFFSQFNGNIVRMSRLVGTPTTASFQVFADLALAASSPPDADQQDSSKQDLDTGNSRFGSQVVFRNNSYWAVQGVAVDGGSDASIRFLEIDTLGNVDQNLTFGTSGDLDLYFPSIAVNASEDAVIGFSWSSSSNHASAGYFTGTTSAGVTSFNVSPFAAPVFGQAGYERLDSVNRNRWGDYSHTVVDPSDPNTFFTFQEWASSEDIWSTRITEIRPTSPDLVGDFFNVVVEPLDAGQTFDVDFRISNDGDLTAGGFDVDFYLSSNDFISTGDRFLGSRFISGLAAGSTTATLTRSLTLPGSDDSVYIGDGQYTIGMIVDGDGDEVESNENNNRNVAEFLDSDNLQIDVYPELPNTLTVAEGFAPFHFDGTNNDIQSFDANIGTNTDVDTFLFAGDSGWTGTYTIDIGDFGGPLDPVVAVYDASTGVQLGADDNSGPDDDAQLNLSLSSSTRYIVAVADVGQNNSGDVSINLNANDSTTPFNISLNSQGMGSTASVIDATADTDFFQFTTPGNFLGSGSVTMTPDTSSLDAAMWLYDAAGNELGRSFVGGAGISETINFAGLTAGNTYHISTLSSNYNSSGSFNLIVDLLVSLACDFDGDGDCDIDDIDLLVPQIASGANNVLFDLTGDGLVTVLDRDQWLSDAGDINIGPGRAYLVGDGNLDGTVDGSDFVIWNTNKFTAVALWSAGDYTVNGFVDGFDFIAWNTNKFMSSDDRSRLYTTRVVRDWLFAALDEDEDEGRRGENAWDVFELA